MAEWQRTHTCGDLNDGHIGMTATLNGWVLINRNFGNQIFVDVRDRYGLTQVVFEGDDADLYAAADKLRREHCVSVTGVVRSRIAGKERTDIPTGRVELKATKLEVLNAAPPLPFSVTEFPDEELANEDLRLQYRYLDLRRRTLQNVLILRHKLNTVIREYMVAHQFLEIETPLLGKSTPEGARDYLVPSRVYNGEFYALPQSPQLYKQLMMVAGYDRYYQIARCLRDEDLRADRQPEFTQLDVEMSFVEQDDVIKIMEGLTRDILKKCLGVEIPTPLPRVSYADAMLKYGSDKPDLRFGLEIQDIGDIAAESEFTVFKSVLAAGGVVRGINAKGAAATFSNSALKPGGELPKVVETYKAKGLAWMKYEGDKFTGSIEKFFPDAVKAKLKERMNVEPGDLVMFVADKEAVAVDSLGALRSYLGAAMKLYRNWWDEKADHEAAEAEAEKAAKKKGQPYAAKPWPGLRPEHFNFLWMVDFPMFGYDDEEKRWVANHHPFTAPRDEDLPTLESDPGKVRAKAYDLVCNGYEVGGGSIRIHRQDVQSRVFAMLGMAADDAKARFGFLLDALNSGAPPHGGIALGLDRWAMILSGTTNIRDVIAFPKNKQARDLMTGAPATVEPRQLKDLGIKLS
jgi:aspartyl-tRNA synthetase